MKFELFIDNVAKGTIEILGNREDVISIFGTTKAAGRTVRMDAIFSKGFQSGLDDKRIFEIRHEHRRAKISFGGRVHPGEVHEIMFDRELPPLSSGTG